MVMYLHIHPLKRAAWSNTATDARIRSRRAVLCAPGHRHQRWLVVLCGRLTPTTNGNSSFDAFGLQRFPFLYEQPRSNSN